MFRLHHGSTLDVMFAKHKRDKFCNIMDKYWSRFAAHWDVLLHGSPAVDIYSGMKLAAGGELGMGVGEEDWGSSERDVLEDFARRTEGLVDVMVSRFGEASPLQQAKASMDPKHLPVSELEPWVGGGKNVDAADGVVFSGLGAVSRKSLRDLSHWVETVYSLGDQAYGIRDNPTSMRTRRKRRNLKPPTSPSPDARTPIPKSKSQLAASNNDPDLPQGIPPPIVKAAEKSLQKASAGVEKGDKASGQEQKPLLASLGDTETWMKYMTLGYGSAWGGKKPAEEAQSTPEPTAPERTPSPEAMRYIEPEPDVDLVEEKLKLQIRQENDGYFLIGLKGDMDEADVNDEDDDDWNHRIPLRTVHVEVLKKDDTASLSPSGDSDDAPLYSQELSMDSRPVNKLSRLRPVVYVVCPCSTIPDSFTDFYPASSVYIYVPVQPPNRFAHSRLLLSRHPQLLLAHASIARQEHITRQSRIASISCFKSPYNHILFSRLRPQHTTHLRSRLRPPHPHRPLQPPQHPRPRHPHRGRPRQQQHPRLGLEQSRSPQRALSNPRYHCQHTSQPL
jgi:hypothetical protein